MMDLPAPLQIYKPQLTTIAEFPGPGRRNSRHTGQDRFPSPAKTS